MRSLFTCVAFVIPVSIYCISDSVYFINNIFSHHDISGQKVLFESKHEPLSNNMFTWIQIIINSMQFNTFVHPQVEQILPITY